MRTPQKKTPSDVPDRPENMQHLYRSYEVLQSCNQVGQIFKGTSLPADHDERSTRDFITLGKSLINLFENDVKERQVSSFKKMGNLKYIRARDIDAIDLVDLPSSQVFAVALELSR